MRSERGMSLMEIMIVVLVISLLALIAIPAVRMARESAQNTRLVADMRIAVMAFDQVAYDPAGFPPDAAPSIIPERMDSYLAKMDWTGPTPVGGQWDWNPDITGMGQGVVVVLAAAQDSRMTVVDTQIDDGNLAAGLFQKIAGSSYAWAVE